FDFTFFFQAEDGIRDRNVTGVQTCALPISFTYTHSKSTPTPVRFMDPKNICICPINQMSEYFHRIRMVTPPSEVESPIHGILDRSEERRVGKECTAWWAPWP